MATPIFLFGTLCHPPLLEAVAGRALQGRAASLPEYRAAWVEGESWPMLEAQVGARAEGLLIVPDEEALSRLDFYEACFDYVRLPLTVEVDGSAREVSAWFPPGEAGTPAEDWSLADWAARWGALSTLAAGEVMRQFGRATPQEIGRRFGIIRARADAWLRARDWQRPGLVGRGFGHADIAVEGVSHAYDGFFTAQEMRVTHARFDGSRSPVVARGVYRVADAVTVLPYDPVRDSILLIEQVRFGPYAHGDAAPWLLEPIAGILDAGETPEATARREAVEEARLNLGELHFIARYYPTPGGVAQVLFSYLGIADLPDDIAGTAGHAAEHEDIQSHVIPYALACRLLAEGDMANAPLVLSMQYLQLNRDRLRASAGAG